MKRLFPFLFLAFVAFSVTPPVDAYQTSAAKEAPKKAEVPAKPLPAGPAVPVRFVPRVRTGPAITLPEEATGDVASFIMVPASTDGAEVVWDTPDQGLSVFPSDLLKSTKVAVVSSAKPGRYRLWAWTAVGGKATPKAQCWIVVGQVPPTPVPPGPIPPTPPDDPLAASLQAIYGADGSPDKAKHKAALAALYRQAATISAQPELKLLGELQEKIKQAAAALLPADAIVPVRARISQEIIATVGKDGTVPIDAALREKFAKLLSRLAIIIDSLR